MENTAVKREERIRRYSQTVRVPLEEIIDTKENVYEMTSIAIKKAAIISNDSELVDLIERQDRNEDTHVVTKESCKVCSIALSEVLCNNKEDSDTEEQ